MRSRRQTNQLIPAPARKVGNLLMGLGVATPFVGIAMVKMFRVIDYDIYPRVIQSIFIVALVLFISGILVKNYWKGGQAAAQKNPFDVWSNVQRTSFDWTGVGCSLMALGPGLFFIIGFLFAREFQYGAIVGFGALVLSLIAGSNLYRLGKVRRAAQLQAGALAKSALTNQSPFAYPTPIERPFAYPTSNESPSTLPTSTEASAIASPGGVVSSLPQIIPGRRPEGFVLVDNSQGTACGLIFFGIFSAVWYGVTLLGLFIVMTIEPSEGSKEGGIIVLILFLLAGLIPLSLFIRLARAGMAFEKSAELVLKNWPLEAGDNVDMNFRCGLRRNLTVMSLEVSLECKKIDRSGSETETDTLDKRSLTVREFKQDGKNLKANWKINMPTTWQLPYESSQKAIGWNTFVTIELAEGPKGVFSFPLLVMPKRELETGDRGDKTALP